MRASTTVDEYLQEVERRLQGQPRRSRILAELRDHLQEGLDEELAAGHADADAARRAIIRCGEPAVVVRPFLRRAPRYLEHRARWLLVIVMGVTLVKLVVFVAVPERVNVYNLDNDVELRQRTLWFLSLFVLVGIVQLGRWAVLKHRGALVEVSSAAELPHWHRRARPWLAVSALGGLALASVGLWAPARWASFGAVLAGLVVAIGPFALARRHFWREAVLQ